MADDKLLDAIEARMKAVFTPLMDKLSSDLKLEISDVKKEVATMGKNIDTISKDQIATALHVIDNEVYQRKWCLVLTGLPGELNESQQSTRDAVLQLGDTILKVKAPVLSACHRLSNKVKNAAIIIRFVDLLDRDLWQSNAGKLKHYRPNGSTVGLSPNLPPVLSQIRKSIFTKRAKLNLKDKGDSKVKYMAKFPYMMITIGKETILPDVSKEDLAKDFFNI